ncbi:MAG: pH regulation protein F [Candidatus Eisenbacteria bacterium]|uniref:PH regulation protein F n=1 Tax=Eiseniibacteriota bacterium TaxID=2212470 RepID=A0A948W682_UNCEI|nr:pH regulation protein F [Candidatus Eisenbacteria bacterium]MBU1947472.1 pH regulation protein F [Candidatus Eisenbacteria bacterium]MBU2690835.1 pH regulation protein F [Candidatus Eisenbacteria bacterium]
MNHFFTITAIILSIVMVLPFYRLVVGPTVFDRMLGAGAIGSKTLVLLTIVGMLYGRVEMFIDIVIAYSLLNFIGVLAAAKYLEKKGIEP